MRFVVVRKQNLLLFHVAIHWPLISLDIRSPVLHTTRLVSLCTEPVYLTCQPIYL